MGRWINVWGRLQFREHSDARPGLPTAPALADISQHSVLPSPLKREGDGGFHASVGPFGSVVGRQLSGPIFWQPCARHGRLSTSSTLARSFVGLHRLPGCSA